MRRLTALWIFALALGATGCSEGAAEAAGDTRSIAAEIPPPKEPPRFTPPGNSLLKTSPEEMRKRAPAGEERQAPGKVEAAPKRSGDF